jgi:hypothetical protein
MERNPVSSGSLNSVGYDPETQVLEIEFQSGEVYQYTGVPREVYAELMHSDSHGRFFLENIRDVYPYIRITS